MTGPSIDTPTAIKFLCSYGGKILPRYPDGKLRYNGGDTRVLSVHRSISFTELLLKLVEMCGATVNLRCQLPTEDLDALVSITSDEDLANLIEEYDRVAPPPSSLKIRAFLSLPRNIKSSSSTSSSSSSSSSPSQSASSTPKKPSNYTASSSSASAARCHRQIPVTPVAVFPQKRIVPHHHHHHHHGYYYANGNPSHIYLIHNGNYWQ